MSYSLSDTAHSAGGHSRLLPPGVSSGPPLREAFICFYFSCSSSYYFEWTSLLFSLLLIPSVLGCGCQEIRDLVHCNPSAWKVVWYLISICQMNKSLSIIPRSNNVTIQKTRLLGQAGPTK